MAVGALPVRTEFARRIVARRPTLIRGNASEIMALAGWESSGRGVDSLDSVQEAIAAGRELAVKYGSVVAISGEADAIIDAQRTVLVHTNGIGLTKVTGGGCALGAVMAAFAAVADPFEAAVAATASYCIASEDAAARAEGPGSFAVHFLDELSRIQPADVLARAAIA